MSQKIFGLCLDHRHKLSTPSPCQNTRQIWKKYKWRQISAAKVETSRKSKGKYRWCGQSPELYSKRFMGFPRVGCVKEGPGALLPPPQSLSTQKSLFWRKNQGDINFFCIIKKKMIYRSKKLVRTIYEPQMCPKHLTNSTFFFTHTRSGEREERPFFWH